MKRPRGYSRQFRPSGASGKRYLLDAIPAGLWKDVRARCAREGVSVRALLLGFLQEWSTLGRPARVRPDTPAARPTSRKPWEETDDLG